MKKMIATVAAMVLTLSMSVTAFAAQSPTLPSEPEQKPDYSGSVIMNDTLVPADAVDANGKAVTVVRKEMTAEAKAAAKDAVVKTFGENTDVLSIGDYHVDGASEENPITLTFKVPVVKAGDEVYVLHNVGNKGTWVKEPATAKDGAVVATFTSFSQMAVVRVAEADQGTQSGGGYSPEYYESLKADMAAREAAAQASQTQSTSPKTAENGVAMVMVAGLAAGAAVLVLVSRKKRA